MSDFGTYTVRIDPEKHSAGEVERLGPATVTALAYIDTVVQILRDGAVRMVLLEVRADLEEQGRPVPSDADLFAMLLDVDGAPHGVADMLTDPTLMHTTMVGGVFRALMDVTALEQAPVILEHWGVDLIGRLTRDG